jgi:spore coat protein CotH
MDSKQNGSSPSASTVLKIIVVLTVIIETIPSSFSQDFYDIETINTIEIFFSQENWDQILDRLFAAGEEERLVGTVLINGVQFDSVGVRYKGNSTYSPSYVKNPLNIKLDHIFEDQTLDGYTTLKLANCAYDASFVREVISYEIARNYMPACEANYANVYINGDLIGLYINVQSVNNFFLSNHFHCNNNPFFKGAYGEGGSMWPEQVWKYYGLDSTLYFSRYELRSDYGWSQLIDFLDVFNNTPQMMEEVLDVDQHLWMLAFDLLTVNLDAPVNMAQNYYLYQDSNERFNPMLWDLGLNFGGFCILFEHFMEILTVEEMQRLDPFLNITNPNFPIISNVLPNPTYNKMYIAHFKTIMDEHFSNGLFLNRVLEIQDLIDEDVQADPNGFFSYHDFRYNVYNSIGSGWNLLPGLTELMDARVTFLSSHPAFQATSPIITDVSYTPSTITPNSTVWFNATVDGAELVQLGFKLSFMDKFEKVQMYDDGNHNDGVAGDGIYGISVIAGYCDFYYYVYSENAEAAAFSPVRAEYEYYTLDVIGDLVINEFMAINDTTVADQNGEYDDWIELYNNGGNSLSLGGYFLSDEIDDLAQWAFPDTFIAPNDYLIIWADDDEGQTGLHTNFRLYAAGEAIYLVDPDTAIVDEVNFRVQISDLSTGRYPNGTGEFVMMTPSFSAENNSGITGIEGSSSHTPSMFILEQNFPNPFNPTTVISYTLQAASKVHLSVYDISGRKIAELINGWRDAGVHEVTFDGSELASGIYFYHLTAGESAATGKMVLIK